MYSSVYIFPVIKWIYCSVLQLFLYFVMSLFMTEFLLTIAFHPSVNSRQTDTFLFPPYKTIALVTVTTRVAGSSRLTLLSAGLWCHLLSCAPPVVARVAGLLHLARPLGEPYMKEVSYQEHHWVKQLEFPSNSCIHYHA